MQTRMLASGAVVLTGIVWGVYWVPVRALGDLGLGAAWGTAAITVAAAILLVPFILADRLALRGRDRIGIAAIVLGGAAFALYSIAFLYGKVAIVVLLWFFSPVWSVLIARYLLRQPVLPLRLVAIAVGLAGLFVMLGGDGGLPVPGDLGEWMAVAGGLLWAFATAGMRERSDLAPVPSAFLFAAGAAGTSLLAAPWLAPVPTVAVVDLPAVAMIVLGTAGLWWVISIAALMWAAVRLDPARLGILLMVEVVVGAATAAAFAGERLSLAEVAGGMLVILSGILEVWPTRSGPAGPLPAHPDRGVSSPAPPPGPRPHLPRRAGPP